MQSTNKIQLILIVLVGGLVAFIFFKGKNDPKALTSGDKEVKKQQDIDNNRGYFDQFKRNAKGSVSDSLSKKITDLERSLANASRDTNIIKKLGQTWEQAEKPGIAAYYYEKIAQQTPSTFTWYRAADNYYEAQKVASDSTLFNYFVDKSIDNFQKVLDKDPSNLNAKADLAVAYIEGRGEVMKGVGLLKEVEQVNPNHRKALFYLGVLSIRSQQYEKALDRFQKLVEIEPENAFNFFYLGRVHRALDNKADAIKAFKQYKSRVQDPKLKQNANDLIKSLKN